MPQVFSRILFRRIAIGAAVVLVPIPRTTLATKPCPPSPCVSSSNTFNETACRENSDWIAVGRITNVKHRREGEPAQKDFARFTFRVVSWEKGAKSGVREFRFQVGWCENQQELPKNTSGPFRFFGSHQPVVSTGGDQYFYFEKLPAR